MKKLKLSLEPIEPFLEKIGDLTKVHRLIICAVTFVLIAGNFYWWIYRPKSAEINTLEENLAALETKLKSAKLKAKNIQKYRNDMREAETQFKIVMRSLPDKKEIPSLLTNVSGAGKEAGLEFLLFDRKPEVLREFYAEIPVAIQVAGPYHNVAQFFDKVSMLSRIVNISDIKMVPGSKADGLTTSCMGITYKFVDTPVGQPTGGKKSGKKSK
jgi:type IV pilus assembly protein PilO